MKAKTPRPAAAPPDVIVGETPLARDFFAGQYAKLVAENFDAESMESRDEDVAFVVGALTFLGRAPEARACLDAWRLRAATLDPRTLAASRFFLGLAFARAGEFQRAHEHLVAGARARTRAPDPWVAAFAFQGLACHRYFTGKYRAAARHALRALRAARGARFAYAQMLSTDLRGHALVQIGQFQAGVALLEQAKSYAERLGFGMNAHAVECSIAIYQATFKTGQGALADLEALLARRSHDSYSQRDLLTQTAIQYALRGRGTDAAEALARVDRDALRMDARRAKVTSLIARLHVTRWGRGARACAELLDDARAFVDESDMAFRAELTAFEAYVGRALDDAPRYQAAIDALGRLSRQTEHHATRAALEQFEGAPPRAFSEDELTPLLRAAIERDESVIARLLALGFFGLLPEVIGLQPSRRVILLARENAVLVQDYGDLWLRPGPPRWAPPLLRLLSNGSASKEALVTGLWGLRRYFPERHDPLIRTSIHRLRAFLDPRGEWVTVTQAGYGLAVPVLVVGASPLDVVDMQLPEDDALDDPSFTLSAPPRPRARAAPVVLSPLDESIRARLREGTALSVPEVARALAISESTALRSLRRLVRAKQATRTGAARATRYRAR